MNLLSILVSLLAMLGAAAGKGSQVISVADQRAFDGISLSVEKAVQAGKTSVVVEIAPGTYRFRDNHIDFRGKNWAGVDLVIRGSGALLVADGPDGPVLPGDFSPERCYLDERLQPVSLVSGMERARSQVRVIDADSGICELDTGDRKLTVSNPEGIYLHLTEWYTSHVYPVERIRRGRVRFRVTELSRLGLSYNVNADVYYGKQYPRYCFYNLPSSRPKSVHSCSASGFLFLSGCAFRSFTLEGLRFRGNSADKRLIHFYFCKEGTYKVTHCVFEHIMGPCVYLTATSGVTLSENEARECARGVFVADTHSRHARILSNTFVNNGTAIRNDFNILCWGEDFLVSGNRCCDYGYGAIGVGRHYMEPKEDYRVTGTVEKNEIWLSQAGYDRAPMTGLMDSGAIYVYTQNDGVTIRENSIHDISGPCDNRGIFCDDGTVNVRILRNRILRVANSYCIDLRRVARIETDPRSKVRKANIGNVMDGNVVDGGVRFERRGGDDGCRVGTNLSVAKTKR